MKANNLVFQHFARAQTPCGSRTGGNFTTLEPAWLLMMITKEGMVGSGGNSIPLCVELTS